MSGNKGCSSILNIDYKNVIESNNIHHFLFKEKIKVKNKKIDDLIEENNLNYKDYNFLNIDAQGAELMVLNGAKKLLSLNYLTSIFVEITVEQPFYENNSSFQDVKNLLKEYNFNLKDIYWHSKNKWGDALFIKEF